MSWPRVYNLPVPLRDINGIGINAIPEPPLCVFNFDIVPAHLSLAHKPVLSKRPILETIRPPPLSRLIMPLVPELNGNLIPKVSQCTLKSAATAPGSMMTLGSLPCYR